MVFSTVLVAQMVVGSSSSPNLHQCLWTYLQVCGSKRLGCHASIYTVSRCCTRGESEDRTGKKTCKNGSTLALKPRTDVTRNPKQGYQWSHKHQVQSMTYPIPLQITLGDSTRKTHKYHRASKLMKPCKNRKGIFVLLLLKC